MPKKFNYFEASIRTLLKKYIQGRKWIYSSTTRITGPGNMCLKCNRALAAECMEYFYKMSDEFGIQNDVKMFRPWPGVSRVLTMEQVPDDEERLWEILSEALKEAAVRFVESRRLRENILRRTF
ncbi:MAG: YicC/YloC family endoribonuclease [Enterocloster clostridioformis]